MPVTKITKKFADKKKEFESIITDPSEFNCSDFNLIKLFQYAIFREEGFNAKSYWSYPLMILNIILFIKRLKIKHKSSPLKMFDSKILIIDNLQIKKSTNSKCYSERFFKEVIDTLNKENINYCIVNTHPISVIDNECKQVVLLNQFYEDFSTQNLNNNDRILLKSLKLTYLKVKDDIPVSKDKQNILKEIIEIFWRNYRVYRELLNNFPNVKIAFIHEHYQQEALIYALRKRNIKIIELQHGLIASEDMFYVYDKKILPVRDKALFADEMWVYGEYWKNVLLNGCEYNESQIKIFGYYLFYEKKFSPQFLEFTQQLKSKYNTIVFATAQKNLESHLAGYINFLLNDVQNKNQNAVILIKPHPSATQDISDFIDKKFSNVFVVNYPLEWLFQICDIHFSIYSTTLFDALMYNLKNNFALKHPLFEDYVNSIVKQNIAYELNMNENVLDKANTVKHTTSHLNPKYFYADVNWDLLLNTVKTV